MNEDTKTYLPSLVILSGLVLFLNHLTGLIYHVLAALYFALATFPETVSHLVGG